MNVTLTPGRYVAAVSGGVDSMVLLDLLHKRPGIYVTVAHFDHGIRDDSHEDRKLVEQTSKQLKLPFVYHKGELGSDTSEDQARIARYAFLKQVKDATGSQAIITAHHQDDLLETAVHNLMRGTGRRGLSPLRSTDGIIRPLLDYPKQRLLDHAQANKLSWREDSTNLDTRYRRNYIRHNLLGKLTSAQKAQLNILLDEIRHANQEIDQLIATVLHLQPSLDSLDKKLFTSMPHSVAKEVMHSWLRRAGISNLTKQLIERLVVAAKTGQHTKLYDVNGTYKLRVDRSTILLQPVTR